MLDIGAGFRAFAPDVDLTLSPGSLAGVSQDLSSPSIDPPIAGRLVLPISEDRALTGFADWGGTGGGGETWQAFGSVTYAFAENWSTLLGYLYIDISKEIDGREVAVGLSGPVLAVS